MTNLNEFTQILAEIDKILNSYDPGQITNGTEATALIAHRANQRPDLEKAIELINITLQQYPYNTELLRRRAYAQCRIVTKEGTYPHLKAAEQDLQTILTLDPNNLYANLNLLETMFTFSGMTDNDIAQASGELANRAELLLLAFRSLQIKAFGYAGKKAKAEALYDEWVRKFPDSTALKFVEDGLESNR